ncbi:MAG TPA: tetratricopeptide repeat protein, partial [Terriglobales bacterium]|nr:tetratricopeptide repeat protein [Terriglobales bacterium]
MTKKIGIICSLAALLCVTAAAQTFEISPQGGENPPPPASPAAKNGKNTRRAPAAAARQSGSTLGWGSNIEVARQARAAEDAVKKGNYALATQYAQRAAEAAPHDSHLWFLLGYAARLSGNSALSLSAFNRGLQEAPGAIEGLSGLAQTYIKMGKTDEAKRLLQQVLASNPRRANDLNVIGELYLSTGDYQQAIAYLSRADSIQPAPRPELLMALAYKRMNKPDQAKAMLQRARNRAPHNPEVLRSVAGYYRDTHDYKEAIAALKQIPNKNADILGELAYTYQLSGDTKAAASTYASAANAAPTQINLQLAAAQAQMNADSLDAAAPFLNRAQQIDNNNYRLHSLRGEIAKRQDRYQDAIREYNLALASMPEAPQEGVLYPAIVRMSLAQMYRAAGNDADTQKQFQIAKATLGKIQVEGPQKATYLLLRGEVRSNLGDLAGANQDLAQAVSLEPDNPDFLLQYGSVLWKMKRLPDAKRAYQKVLALDASNRWALTSLGYLSRELSDNKAAESYFKKLAAAYPKDYVAYLALGDLYTSQRQFSKAQSAYETGYKMSPTNAMIVAGGANAAIESHQFPVAATWLARAKGEMNQEPHLMRERERYLTWTGKYAESAAIGYQVVKKLPHDRDAIVYLGYDLLHLGRYDDLLALTSDFEKTLPKEPDLPLLAGYVHKRSNLLHEALDDFTRTIERGPKIVTAYINRGYVLNDLQNAQQATADFQQAIKLEPKNGEAHLGLAFAHLELHHGRAALQEADLAEKYMGENGSIYVAKATAYRQAGLLQQAEKAYRAALKYNPDDLPLTMALADTLYHMRRYDDSVKVLNAALALEPDDPFIYAQMAQAKAELKDRADTVRYVEAAERSGGDQSAVLLATGDALLTLGDRDAAMQRFERAMDAPDSDRIQARLHIAKLMQRDGHWDEAREQVALAFAESRIGEASPVTAENMMEAGDIFLRMHDFDMAQRLFTRAKAAGAADQVVAVALANTYLAQGKTENAEMELASLGNPSDYQENYDYMLARANMLRQQHQNVRALSAFAHANSISGEDDIAERQLRDLAGQEGYQINDKISVASDLTLSPIFDNANLYMQESRLRGLSDGSSQL